jgi:hypothetical protein
VDLLVRASMKTASKRDSYGESQRTASQKTVECTLRPRELPFPGSHITECRFINSDKKATPVWCLLPTPTGDKSCA